jgi:hypothetical protein
LNLWIIEDNYFKKGEVRRMKEKFYISALQVDDSESYDSLEEVTAKAYEYFSKIKSLKSVVIHEWIEGSEKGPMRFVFQEKSGKINHIDIKRGD